MRHDPGARFAPISLVFRIQALPPPVITRFSDAVLAAARTLRLA